MIHSWMKFDRVGVLGEWNGVLTGHRMGESVIKITVGVYGS